MMLRAELAKAGIANEALEVLSLMEELLFSFSKKLLYT